MGQRADNHGIIRAKHPLINGRTGVAMRELLLKIRALLLRFGAAD